jgi:hypothetical protein
VHRTTFVCNQNNTGFRSNPRNAASLACILELRGGCYRRGGEPVDIINCGCESKGIFPSLNHRICDPVKSLRARKHRLLAELSTMHVRSAFVSSTARWFPSTSIPPRRRTARADFDNSCHKFRIAGHHNTLNKISM